MSKQFFKKTASHAKLSFLLCIDISEMENVQPLLLFFTGDSYLLSFCMLDETNFPYEEGYSTAHSIFEAFVQQRKDHFGLFLNKHVVEEAKILIKFIVVDSYIVHKDAPAPLRPHLFKTPTP